jgi:hypothetical protein
MFLFSCYSLVHRITFSHLVQKMTLKMASVELLVTS